MTVEIDERERREALARLAAAREQQIDNRRTYKLEDFLYDTQQNSFWCRPTASLLEAAAVNALIPLEHWRVPTGERRDGRPPAPIAPARDLQRIENALIVEGSTWLPGREEIVQDLYASKDGFFPMRGARIYNTYRPPLAVDSALAEQAGIWVNHVKHLFPEPEEHEYFLDLVAHMVQKPEEKANAIVILSGSQGIGKDALLAPIRRAVGEWNCRNISPDEVLDKNNPWAACVMLTIDEVRPMSDDHRASSMYEALKALSVAPPHTIGIKEKYEKQRWIANCLRVFATTNDRLAFFIPEEDRRVLLLHSTLPPRWHLKAGRENYFRELFRWMNSGGEDAVAAWLVARDIRNFDPQGVVPRTTAWAGVTDRWKAPHDEIAQSLDMLGWPEVVFAAEMLEQLFDGVVELDRLMKSRAFPWKMQQLGYDILPLPEDKKMWRRRGKGGFEFRSRRAYYRPEAFPKVENAYEAAQSRLVVRSDAGPNGAVPRPKVEPLEGGPQTGTF